MVYAPKKTPAPLGTKLAPFKARQGLTFVIEACVTTPVGMQLDLTNRAGFAQIKLNISDISPAATFAVVATNPTLGIATLTLGATVTAGLVPGLYIGDVEFVLGTDPEDVVGSQVFYVDVQPEVTK